MAEEVPKQNSSRKAQQGLGFLQVMLVLLVVSAALGAGALLLYAKRPGQQAAAQEQALRWADEAVAAFAARNARLPCPASIVDGEEDCTNNSQGWLPTQTLVGPAAQSPLPGPLAYLVFRGEGIEENSDDPGQRPAINRKNVDLSAVSNSYEPMALQDVRRSQLTDEDGNLLFDPKDTQIYAYNARNTFDMCLNLAALESDIARNDRARVRQRDQSIYNVAYAIAAAGPQLGDQARHDGSNADSTGQFESPWRSWGSDYDDRVRVRSFSSLATALGCRLQETLGYAANATTAQTHYSTALAGIDALAAAVSIHDSLNILKETNVGNAEVGVEGATFARDAAIVAIILSAGQITDTVSSNFLAVMELLRAIATCILSLGTTCAEVALKISAIALEVSSIISNAVAAGLNVGSLVMASEALSLHQGTLNWARSAASPPPDSDLDSAIEELRLSLDGGMKPICQIDTTGKGGDWRPDFDGNGNLVQKYINDCDKDPNNSNGTWQTIYVPGITAEIVLAQQKADLLNKQASLVKIHRLDPFNEANILQRIDATTSIDLKFNGTARYESFRCDYVGTGQGDYILNGGQCLASARVDGNMTGTHTRVRYFNQTLAVSDARNQISKIQSWARLDLRIGEVKEQYEQLTREYNRWFNKGGLLDQMKKDTDGQCDSARDKSLRPDAREIAQKRCDANRNAVYVMETCLVPQLDPKTNQMVERLLDNPDATCKPLMRQKLQGLKNELDTIDDRRDALYASVHNTPAPAMTYPAIWQYSSIEEVKDSSGNPADYVWLTNSNGCPSISNLTCPFHAIANYGYGSFNQGARLLLRSDQVKVTGLHLIADVYAIGTTRTRYPYSRAYGDWLRAEQTAQAARTQLEQLQAQEYSLRESLRQLEELQAQGASSSGTVQLIFGVEQLLQRADQRGSLGDKP